MFSKSINFKIKYCKKCHCRLCKISRHYENVIDQRLIVFHYLFSWTTVRPSKCPINKMISSQGHLTVSAFPWVPCVQAKNCMTKIFSKWIIFEIMHCKTFHCPLSKFSLHSLTASLPEASRLSPTVQLDISWTLEMSNRQNNWFTRPSESLSSSPGATWHHAEALSKLILSKWMEFQTNH